MTLVLATLLVETAVLAFVAVRGVRRKRKATRDAEALHIEHRLRRLEHQLKSRPAGRRSA